MAGETDNRMQEFNPAQPNNCAIEWKDYKWKFLVHLDSIGLHDAPGRRKVGKLLDCTGEDHIHIYDTFTWAPAIDEVPTYAENGIEAVAAQPGEDRYDL